MARSSRLKKLEYNRKWQREHREHLNAYKKARYDPLKKAATRRRKLEQDPLYDRRIKIRYKYGIELEEFDALLAIQDHRCACCLKAEPGGLGWTVHHSHKTGNVLAILCNLCNGGSGMLQDDPVLLRRMAEINSE